MQSVMVPSKNSGFSLSVSQITGNPIGDTANRRRTFIISGQQLCLIDFGIDSVKRENVD